MADGNKPPELTLAPSSAHKLTANLFGRASNSRSTIPTNIDLEQLDLSTKLL